MASTNFLVAADLTPHCSMGAFSYRELPIVDTEKHDLASLSALHQILLDYDLDVAISLGEFAGSEGFLAPISPAATVSSDITPVTQVWRLPYTMIAALAALDDADINQVAITWNAALRGQLSALDDPDSDRPESLWLDDEPTETEGAPLVEMLLFDIVELARQALTKGIGLFIGRHREIVRQQAT